MKTLIKKPPAELSLTATLTIAFLAFGVLLLSISSGLQLFSSLQTQQTVISSNQHLIVESYQLGVNSYIVKE